MRVFLETPILVPTLLLLVASVFDVVSARFPNWLFIASMIAGVTWLWSTAGLDGAMKGLGIAAIIFVAMAPLVFMKALGAGDIKLLTAFSLFTSWHITFFVFVYSLIWGLIMGLSKVIIAGEGKTFFTSMVLRTIQVKSQKIPYTVAILLGWFTWLVWGGLT